MEYTTPVGSNLVQVDPEGPPLSIYLGVFGMPGKTVIFVVNEIVKRERAKRL